MGALAAAGWAWSARGDPGYTEKWAGLARHCHCMPRSWVQLTVRVQWDFLNEPARRLGAFSAAGARQLRASLHYSSSLKCDCGLCVIKRKC